MTHFAFTYVQLPLTAAMARATTSFRADFSLSEKMIHIQLLGLIVA